MFITVTIRHIFIIQHKITKCTLYKLIFQCLTLVSSTCFEPKDSSPRRRLYIQLWYCTFYMNRYMQSGGQKNVFKSEHTRTHSHTDQTAHTDTCKIYQTAYTAVYLRMDLRGSNHVGDKQTKLRGLSPHANYTDRAAAAGRRSQCQLLRIEGCHVASATGPHSR